MAIGPGPVVLEDHIHRIFLGLALLDGCWQRQLQSRACPWCRPPRGKCHVHAADPALPAYAAAIRQLRNPAAHASAATVATIAAAARENGATRMHGRHPADAALAAAYAVLAADLGEFRA